MIEAMLWIWDNLSGKVRLQEDRKHTWAEVIAKDIESAAGAIATDSELYQRPKLSRASLSYGSTAEFSMVFFILRTNSPRKPKDCVNEKE